MAHVTFIHGIGNKPKAEDLHRGWRVALFDDDGLDLDALGVTSSLVYWADMLYASPVPEDTAHESSQLELERIVESEDADMTWLADVPDDERDFVERLAREVGLAEVTPTTDEVAPDPIVPGSPLELIPLPAGLRRRLMRVLLRDVHHFLYDAPFSPRPGENFHIRTDVRARALDALHDDADRPGPHLVVGHSLGSVIAYDALTAIDDAPKVDALMTVGSPLGISEVREGLTPPWTSHDGWPSQRVGEGRWTNVYDPLDPVCGIVDRAIGTHFRQAGVVRVDDVGVSNTGSWRHSIGKYLGQPALRDFMRQVLR